MIDLQAFRGIAADTTVSDRKFVYFANGKEADGGTVAEFSKLCFNAEGKPREFRRPEGLDREQGSILMRSKLLSAVRDQLGADSPVFKEIETKLFGSLVKGQFDPKVAAQPLRKRDIQAVLKMVDKEMIGPGPTIADAAGFTKAMNRAGSFVSFGKGVSPELRATLEQAFKKNPTKSTKTLAQQAWTIDGGGAAAYKTMLRTALGKLTDKNPIPDEYRKDSNRMSSVELPGGNRYTTSKCDGGGTAIDGDELKNRIAQHVIGADTFAQLQGVDLRKAQFLLANTHQGGSLACAQDAERTMLGKTGLMLNDSACVETFINGIDRTSDGGVRFTATRIRRISDVVDDQGQTYSCDPSKSYLLTHFEIEFSGEKLAEILQKDWRNLDDAALEPTKVSANGFIRFG